ncbi:MAG UNVERIFIED_CONTAM: class I SAM-dependent methyltransferase [Microcystis novacekii LVE1205-3]|jgi:protein-L-isoaspartate(D-aspartate) O-methyltransferase
MIARAEKKLEELNIENIDLINADIAAIDFAESSFDLITCSLAIALFPISSQCWQNGING